MVKGLGVIPLAFVIAAVAVGGTASAVLLVVAALLLVPFVASEYRSIKKSGDSPGRGGGDGSPPGVGLPF